MPFCSAGRVRVCSLIGMSLVFGVHICRGTRVCVCVCVVTTANGERRQHSALDRRSVLSFLLSILRSTPWRPSRLPTKAAPTPRKAPPQVPTVPTAGTPGNRPAMWRCSSSLLLCAPAGGGDGVLGSRFAAQIDMEDRTALMEFVAVMSMVPPANMRRRRVRCQEHMSTLFPARATTATAQEAVHRRWRLRRYRPSSRPIQGRRPRRGPARSNGSHRHQGRRLRARTPRRCQERRSSTHLRGHLHRRGRRRHPSWEQSRRAGRSSTCRRWKPSRRCLQEHRRRHLGWSPNTRSTRLGCAQGCRRKGRCTPCLDDNPGRHLLRRGQAQQSSGRRLRTLGLLRRRALWRQRRSCLRRRRRSCWAWTTATTATRSLIHGPRRHRRPREQADEADHRGGTASDRLHPRTHRRRSRRWRCQPHFRRPLVAAPVLWSSTPPRAGAAAAERPIRSSFPPARMPTEPAQAPDCWDMPASSQAGTADDQSAHDRRQLRETVGGCQTTVRDGGSLSEPALQETRSRRWRGR